MDAIPLSSVLSAWMQAKEDERKAIEFRRCLDRQIQAMLPKKEEGSVSKDEGNYKVTVTYKVDRKLDVDSLRESWGALPSDVQSSIRWKAELSVSQFRELNEDGRKLLSGFVTTKPASPSVSVEIREQ